MQSSYLIGLKKDPIVSTYDISGTCLSEDIHVLRVYATQRRRLLASNGQFKFQEIPVLTGIMKQTYNNPTS